MLWSVGEALCDVDVTLSDKTDSVRSLDLFHRIPFSAFLFPRWFGMGITTYFAFMDIKTVNDGQ